MSDAPSPLEVAEQAVKLASRFAQAKKRGDAVTCRAMAKKLVVLAWAELPINSRHTFIACTDFMTREFVPLPDLPEGIKRDLELSEILRDWPKLARDVDTPEVKGFALSILKQSRSIRWKPSDAQEAHMKRIHAQWKRNTKDHIPDDMEVTED